MFILAGLSDAADGLIARLFNQKSELGAFLDPLADKILLIAAFVALPFNEMSDASLKKELDDIGRLPA